jgi:hypothetical protein
VDEQRRHLALGDPGGEADIDLARVVEHLHRPPGWIVAGDRVAEAQSRKVDAVGAGEVGLSVGLGIADLERQKFALRIAPGDLGHVSGRGRMRLQMIAAPVGQDDEVVLKWTPSVGPRGPVS